MEIVKHGQITWRGDYFGWDQKYFLGTLKRKLMVWVLLVDWYMDV